MRKRSSQRRHVLSAALALVVVSMNVISVLWLGPALAAASVGVVILYWLAVLRWGIKESGSSRGSPAGVRKRQYLVPRDLPPGLAWFFGREEEVAAAVSHLGRPALGEEPRLVTVSGPAGVGKTALAVHVAHIVAKDFPGGQLFVQANVVTSLARTDGEVGFEELRHDVLGRLVTALADPGERLPDGRDDRRRRYDELVRTRDRVLILFDDVEHAELLSSLLPARRGWGVVATGREIPQDLGVEPLSLRLGPLSRPQAEALFREMVGDERVDREPTEASQIIDLTGCHPLSLHVAAASVAGRPHSALAQVLRQMEESGAARDPLELSVCLLTEREQLAFRLLGLVGEHRFRVWVLAALMETDELSAERIADRLLHAGLIERTGNEGAGVPTFTMPEPVFRYARAQATELVALEEQRRLLGLVDAARERRRRRPIGELQTTVYTPLSRGQMNSALGGARRAVTLARERRDAQAEGLALAAFAEVRAELGNLEVASELAFKAYEIGGVLGRVRALRCLGRLHWRQRQIDKAEELLRAGLDNVREDDASERIRLLRELAITLSLRTDPRAAVRVIQEAFVLCDAMPEGGRHRRGALLWARSVVLQANDDLAGAARSIAEGVRLTAELEQRLWHGWLLYEDSRLAHRRGDDERARGRAFRALETFEAMSHRYGKAHCRLFIGCTYVQEGRPEDASPILTEAVENFLNCGDRWAEAEAMRMLARAHGSRGDTTHARQLLRVADRRFAGLGDTAARERVAREIARLGLELRAVDALAPVEPEALPGRY